MTGARQIAREKERNRREAIKDLRRTPPTLRVTYEDGERAFNEWGANCGPAAIAAVTGKTLDELRPFLGDFESKHYTNPTLMFETLRRLSVNFEVTHRADVLLPSMLGFPAFGLARIQWGGAWTKPGVPMQARYRQTHWVASCHGPSSRGIFDVNALNSGGWVGFADWRDVIVPHLLTAYPRSDGTWWVTHGIEVYP
jgi:hypothetical protein